VARAAMAALKVAPIAGAVVEQAPVRHAVPLVPPPMAAPNRRPKEKFNHVATCTP